MSTPGSRVPIACSLTPPELNARRETFRALAASHLVGRTRTAAGALLEFRDDGDGAVESAVRELARAEQACCPFFVFAITRQDDTVRWQLTAPEDAQPFVDAILTALGDVA